jgi:hypothetical protein
MGYKNAIEALARRANWLAAKANHNDNNYLRQELSATKMAIALMRREYEHPTGFAGRPWRPGDQ